jgi:hypothetical protein
MKFFDRRKYLFKINYFTIKNKTMKKVFQHDALENYCPITGEYNETLNQNGEILVHGKNEICPTCAGYGRHFRSDLDESSLYQSMVEDGDIDGIDHYMNGAFDEVCRECNGNKVLWVPNLPEWAQVLIDKWEEEEAEWRRYSDMERRMGA